jgi:hypothetical protein
VAWLEVIEGAAAAALLAARLAFSALIKAFISNFEPGVGVLPSMFQVRSIEERSGVEGITGGNGALSSIFDSVHEGTAANELEPSEASSGRRCDCCSEPGFAGDVGVSNDFGGTGSD